MKGGVLSLKGSCLWARMSSVGWRGLCEEVLADSRWALAVWALWQVLLTVLGAARRWQAARVLFSRWVSSLAFC